MLTKREKLVIVLVGRYHSITLAQAAAKEIIAADPESYED